VAPIEPVSEFSQVPFAILWKNNWEVESRNSLEIGSEHVHPFQMFGGLCRFNLAAFFDYTQPVSL